MTLHKNHPARSHEFLSRLHDGELEPSERAHFETHRAHCKECRDAAASFERALSLFRSSRSSPPPKDLASRVLRKVQAHTGSRRTPFGSLLSVDLRWAGAFAAALLLVLVAAPIVLRQQQAIAPGPIPVELQARAAPTSDKDAGASLEVGQPAAPNAGAQQGRLRAQAAQDGLKPAEARSVSKFASAPPEDAKREKKGPADELAAKPAFQEKPQAPASASASDPVVNRASSSLSRQLVGAPAAAPPPEPSGGEGARDSLTAAGEAPPLDRASRIVVRPLDGLGVPPDLDTQAPGPGLNDLRGRSYIVLIDGEGRVIDARETTSKAAPERREAAVAKEKDATPVPAAAELKSLRFKAGDRPRRLLIRVE